MKITYLFTTFPLLSESFLQREVEAMGDLGVELELFSLFRGEPGFQGVPVHRFRWWHWLKLPLALPREFIRHPQAFLHFARELSRGRPADLENLLETLLGTAFAVTWARHFRKTGRDHLHAAWATSPATAALLLADLTDTPFSVGAHAYDVFRGGGDWLLETKLRRAALVRTSTEATRGELIRRGSPPERTVMIRRGLTRLPPMNPMRPGRASTPIRLLSVGRLVEKKGFDDLLRICSALRDAGVLFECRIVGGGPLRPRLERLRSELGMEGQVTLTGARPFTEVQEHYRWADVFCFTGRIAASNDRDGLPNVLGEAMAYGLPVVSSAVSGTVEAIADGQTGRLLDPSVPDQWIRAIQALAADDGHYQALRAGARAWVEENFDARQNAARLLQTFTRAAGPTDQAVLADLV